MRVPTTVSAYILLLVLERKPLLPQTNYLVLSYAYGGRGPLNKEAFINELLYVYNMHVHLCRVLNKVHNAYTPSTLSHPPCREVWYSTGLLT